LFIEATTEAASPDVAVGFLLDDGGFFDEFFVADPDSEGEVLSGGEGRVNVDEVDFAGETGEEGGHDDFVVAPDEHVSPFGVVCLLGEEVSLSLLPVGFGFVDGLDDLEGEDGSINGLEVAFFVVFAVPYKFGHFGCSFDRKAIVAVRNSWDRSRAVRAVSSETSCMAS
jgi:hypothetical protein